MDHRVGERIIRDRWGEPIAPLPPNPKRPKPKYWLACILHWIWRNSRVGPEGPTQFDGEAIGVVSDHEVMDGKQPNMFVPRDELCRARKLI